MRRTLILPAFFLALAATLVAQSSNQPSSSTTVAELSAPEPALAAVHVAEPAAAPLPAETRSLPGPQVTSSAAAQNRFFNGPQADHLLGDWNGWRSSLARHGVQFTGYWTGIASGNPIGGLKQGHTTTVDDTFIVANLDLNVLAHLKNTGLQLSFIDRGGRGLSNEYIGGQYNVQQCVGGQAPFFYQMFFQQQLDEGKLIYKAGRMSASDDMNASPLYGLYLNNGFDGDIRNILFDTQSSAYPFPTWGGYLHYNLSKQVYIKTAIFQTTADIWDSGNHGLDWAIHNGDSAITMNEIAWTPRWKTGQGIGARELPGHYWLGGTYTPWKGFTQFLTPKQLAGDSYGFYVHADQMIYRPSPTSKANTTLWAAAAYYPQQNISIVPLQINAGLVDQGRFGRRSEDKTIFGFLYGQFSREYAQKIVAQGKGNPNHEMIVEVAHRIQVAKHTFLQPDLQWDLKPAGTGRIANALVAATEIGVTF
jgi:porin